MQHIQDITYLYMDVNGSFEQHPQLNGELQDFLNGRNIKSGRCIGLYFVDPDAVQEAELHWQIGFEVYGELDVFPNGYNIRTLKGLETLVGDS